MSGKLTRAQAEVLAMILDWSADYEVAERLHAEPTIRQRRGVRMILRRLTTLEYAMFAPDNWTYRITPAGRSALSNEPTPSEGSGQ